MDFYTDGDAQYDPGQLRLLAAHIADDVDIVQGYKTKRNDPLHRKVLGGIYQHTIRALFGLRVRDVDCDFRLIRKSLMDRVTLTRHTGAICAELMYKTQNAGARVREVGVTHYFRVYGRSQIFNVPRLVASVVQLAQLWWELVAVPKRKAR
ncbi:MAG: hypothetical protein M5R36_25010 [Deltaproteobacteria bacterium]|nr:hypothetical protein [Deltaproteobacteria bacterium]